ncbi:transmembrane protein 65-like [Saccoglossus kowalevskii]|uniref:Transmembrane protein 65-like n=1 Tax=Saccoglossus kowalevskii TaxID=10224 RepID=A0ABM0M4A7_SACKO|nr:PREDICTED: transmembrane protein 65-like [Saccoglossus kowalevskii]
MAASVIRHATRRAFQGNSLQILHFRIFCPVTCSQRTIYSRRGVRIDTPEKTEEFIAVLDSKERRLLLSHLRSLEELTASDRPVQSPSTKQLRQIGLCNAVPFIGFGFLDNAIMIIAGDYIDYSIGAVFGISVLAAAALGNLVSDLAGVGLAGYVEALASKIGVHRPHLTREQVDMNSTRYSASLGRAIGISIGCILGMFPLFFLKKSEKKEENSKENIEDANR